MRNSVNIQVLRRFVLILHGVENSEQKTLCARFGEGGKSEI